MADESPHSLTGQKNISKFATLNPSGNPSLEKTLLAISAVPEGKLLIEKALDSKLGIFLVFNEQLQRGTGGGYYDHAKLIALTEGNGLGSQDLLKAV